MVIDTLTIYYFVDPDLGFKKERATEKVGFDFEKGTGKTLLTCIGIEESFMQSLSAFFIVFLNSFDSPRCFRIGEKMHTKAAVDVSRGKRSKSFTNFSTWAYQRDWGIEGNYVY